MHLYPAVPCLPYTPLKQQACRMPRCRWNTAPQRQAGSTTAGKTHLDRCDAVCRLPCRSVACCRCPDMIVPPGLAQLIKSAIEPYLRLQLLDVCRLETCAGTRHQLSGLQTSKLMSS